MQIPFLNWKRTLLLAGLVAVVVGAYAVMPAFQSGARQGPRLTHRISRGDLVVTVLEQGTLESSNNSEIKCKVRGFSTVIWVIEGGTYVEPGDELVRLDTKQIEEAVSLGKTNTHMAMATLERSKADVAKAQIAIDAYLEGRYRSQYKSLEQQIAIASSNLTTAEKMHEHSKAMFQRGYVSELEVEGNAFTVTQAKLELKVKKTQLEVLEKFTKEMELETLRGNLTASKSKMQADEAGLAMDRARRDRALEELGACVVKADRAGLVIYPSAAAWKNTPDIAEGANVRKDQVLLLMPDLSKMQVKVGVHESVIDRIKPGLKARVTLPDRELEAEVSTVATVTRPAGWWTGNVVKYDTIIELPSVEGLKPGMSAEVEIEMATHRDVLTIPISAVIQEESGNFCWVQTDSGMERRKIQLGDTNDVFFVVEDGVIEGEEVALNAEAFEEKTEEDSDLDASLADPTDASESATSPSSGQGSQQSDSAGAL